MAGLTKALADAGHNVTFVAQNEISADRVAQGWTVPDLGGAQLKFAPTKAAVKSIVAGAPAEAIHICQGIRSNGLVSVAQKSLRKLGRKQLVVMETVDDQGWQGAIKRLIYRFLFFRFGRYLSGVLASGISTRNWLIKRGVASHKVFPFAYFLPETETRPTTHKHSAPDRYRILFVGQFIELKRLDILITAISRLDSKKVELAVVGSGPLEDQLKLLAEDALPGRVDWVGGLPMDEVRAQMVLADCLVLPSRHDGWGAVVSEALMSGTPAICSDACGAAVVAKASGYGGVFKSGRVDDLVTLLDARVGGGRLSDQQCDELAEWARCLAGPAGAEYLKGILEAIETSAPAPKPPWNVSAAESGH
ncbi:glycosyltransferase family 4 protein [uncultured Marinobacter sp.]|uniref:glycosyltransferase family 4 protein n=1 Tax=uncultured Marinobacter sp. TaxID=187379 RepID=UPI00260CB3ED|nr:glycosyltransferase family 4 protein [uncultured Marinobacter sp.]